MRSHDLARALLAHRDNDLRVIVTYNNDPSDANTPDVFHADRVEVDDVDYDSLHDQIILTAGVLFGPAWDPSPVPCADGCSDPQRHAEGGHDV